MSYCADAGDESVGAVKFGWALELTRDKDWSKEPTGKSLEGPPHVLTLLPNSRVRWAVASLGSTIVGLTKNSWTSYLK